MPSFWYPRIRSIVDPRPTSSRTPAGDARKGHLDPGGCLALVVRGGLGEQVRLEVRVVCVHGPHAHLDEYPLRNHAWLSEDRQMHQPSNGSVLS